MELRERLLRLKNQRKMTTETLSARSGVPKGTINKLLAGQTRNPTAQTLKRLAEALECPLEALCVPPDELPGVRKLSDMLQPEQAMIDRGELMHVNRRRIPVIGAIAAGEPLWGEEEVMTACCDHADDAQFAMRVEGDSMIGARIFPGDLVFIRRQEDVDDGQIAAVIIDGKATLKRVYHITNGLQLLSENPKYPPMLFTFDQHDDIRILGKAVAFHSRIQ